MNVDARVKAGMDVQAQTFLDYFEDFVFSRSSAESFDSGPVHWGPAAFASAIAFSPISESVGGNLTVTVEGSRFKI